MVKIKNEEAKNAFNVNVSLTTPNIPDQGLGRELSSRLNLQKPEFATHPAVEQAVTPAAKKPLVKKLQSSELDLPLPGSDSEGIAPAINFLEIEKSLMPQKVESRAKPRSSEINDHDNHRERKLNPTNKASHNSTTVVMQTIPVPIEKNPYKPVFGLKWLTRRDHEDRSAPKSNAHFNDRHQAQQQALEAAKSLKQAKVGKAEHAHDKPQPHAEHNLTADANSRLPRRLSKLEL